METGSDIITQSGRHWFYECSDVKYIWGHSIHQMKEDWIEALTVIGPCGHRQIGDRRQPEGHIIKLD